MLVGGLCPPLRKHLKRKCYKSRECRFFQGEKRGDSAKTWFPMPFFGVELAFSLRYTLSYNQTPAGNGRRPATTQTGLRA
jgi:hypothetical protein